MKEGEEFKVQVILTKKGLQSMITGVSDSMEVRLMIGELEFLKSQLVVMLEGKLNEYNE